MMRTRIKKNNTVITIAVHDKEPNYRITPPHRDSNLFQSGKPFTMCAHDAVKLDSLASDSEIAFYYVGVSFTVFSYLRPKTFSNFDFCFT